MFVEPLPRHLFDCAWLVLECHTPRQAPGPRVEKKQELWWGNVPTHPGNSVSAFNKEIDPCLHKYELSVGRTIGCISLGFAEKELIHCTVLYINYGVMA